MAKHSESLGSSGMCPQTVDRRVSAIQGAGLEGCLQFRGLEWRGVCNSGGWIGGVSAI